MSDLIEVQSGTDFWMPTSDAELRAVYDVWDVPQCGVVASGGTLYLFANLVGALATSGICAYLRVSDYVVEELRRLDADDLRATVDQMLLAHPIVVTAHQDNMVLDSVVLEPLPITTTPSTIDDLIGRATLDLLRQVQRRRDDEDAWTHGVEAIAV